MTIINNIDIFDALCKQNKPVIVCGNQKKISAICKILVSCKIVIKKTIIDFRSVYDLLYEDIENIFIFVVPSGKEEQFQWESVLEEIGFLPYDNYIVFQNNGNVADWGAIDVNIGYTYKSAGMFQNGYYQYGNSDSEITIITLGGSTTTSYEMWNVRSWPEIMYEKFRHAGKKVKILNGGIAGYNSCQELLKILRDINALRPDLVICFSGLNDAVYNNYNYPYYTPHIQAIYEGFVNSTDKYCLPLSYGQKNTKEPGELWIKNMEYIFEILRLNQIDFLAFLQPFIVSEGYEMDYEEKYLVNSDPEILKCLQLERDFLSNVKPQMRDIEFMKDISDCFNGYKGLFRDQYHVYEAGNTIIAEHIYNEIIKRFRYCA